MLTLTTPQPAEAPEISQEAARQMLEALVDARNQFSFYAQQHHAKGTDDATKKARVNETMVARMQAAIAAATRAEGA